MSVTRGELPVYDAVYVVSDLHLGGYSGRWDASLGDWVDASGSTLTPTPDKPDRSFRIFRDAPALASTIRQVAAANGDVALVLNGDIVDFLAEPNAVGFDADGALGKLQRIVADAEQSPVWQALREFTKQPNHDLVLIIGNHDLELALHDVSDWLLDFLSEGDTARRHRVLRCFDGEGYRFRVGAAEVLCVHGNSADPWNEVDYETLGRFADARRSNTRPPKFPVNAGSTLVVTHMNAVKRRFQWVDLLKPEREGSAIIVQALDAGRSLPIRQFIRNFFRGAGMAKAMFIGVPESEFAEQPTVASDDAENLPSIRELFAEAVRLDYAGVQPIDLVDDEGMLEASFAASRKVDFFARRLTLREVLRDYLPTSRAFEFDGPDPLIGELDRQVDGRVAFLIAGHTHLERCLQRKHGGTYFNSGTWIKLVRIPSSVLTLQSSFAPVEEVLRNGSIEALERSIPLGTGAERPLLMSIRTVVRVWAEGAQTHGALYHVEAAGADFALGEVKGTRQSVTGAGR